MTKTVLIIGGGVAGLCTGSFAAANGFCTTIYEMNNYAGGLCCAWPKNGYTVDFCLQWFMGASVGTSSGELYRDWEFVGAFDELEYDFPDEFMRFVDSNGDMIAFTNNLDTLEQHLCKYAPEDSTEIRRLINCARHFAKRNIGLSYPRTKREWLKAAWQVLPLLPELLHYKKYSSAGLSKRFKNTFLADALTHFWEPEASALVIVALLAWTHLGICGAPIGGSRAFVKALEKRYCNRGGTIHYGAQVTRIIVKNNQAIGVELKSGEEVFADYVISAADGHSTFFELLEGNYTTPKIAKRFQEMPTLGPLLFLSFGVNRTFENFSHQLESIMYRISPTIIADRMHEWLPIKIHSADHTLAPAGKTALNILLHSDFDFWHDLAIDQAAYEAMKKTVIAQVTHCLETCIPGITQQIEMTEIVTPLTVQKQTGNWRGAYVGWLPTPQAVVLHMEKTVPGLENCFMVGHWVQPGGGLPSCVMSAKEAVALLCKKEKRPFFVP